MRKFLFLFSTILIVFSLVACNNQEDEDQTRERAATPVEIDVIKEGDLTIEQSVYGQISPKEQRPVLLQQAGEITDLKVEAGDEVKKGDRLATLKTQMGQISITAPVAGTIGQLSVNEHDFVSGEEPLALIFNDEKVHLHFSVTPEMKDKFTLDKTYKVLVDGEKYEATLIRKESLPNETGQYEMQAEIDNEKRNIALGAIAELSLKEVLHRDTILVPTEAILTEGDDRFIFIVQDGKAKKVEVDVIETQTEWSAIDAAVKAKDEVIVTGQFLLSDGSKVDPVKEGK